MTHSYPTRRSSDLAGICEHRVHRPAALLQPRHAEAGVEAATEGQDDVGGAGIGDWGFEIRESGLLRHEGIHEKLCQGRKDQVLLRIRSEEHTLNSSN